MYHYPFAVTDNTLLFIGPAGSLWAVGPDADSAAYVIHPTGPHRPRPLNARSVAHSPALDRVIVPMSIPAVRNFPPVLWVVDGAMCHRPKAYVVPFDHAGVPTGVTWVDSRFVLTVAGPDATHLLWDVNDTCHIEPSSLNDLVLSGDQPHEGRRLGALASAFQSPQILACGRAMYIIDSFARLWVRIDGASAVAGILDQATGVIGQSEDGVLQLQSHGDTAVLQPLWGQSGDAAMASWQRLPWRAVRAIRVFAGVAYVVTQDDYVFRSKPLGSSWCRMPLTGFGRVDRTL